MKSSLVSILEQMLLRSQSQFEKGECFEALVGRQPRLAAGTVPVGDHNQLGGAEDRRWIASFGY